MADRFPEAELVLDDELVFDDGPRRSTLLRRTDDRAEQMVREGEVLAGKYRVERIPGRNGLGVLVHVRHMELGQEVTLKFLVPDACAYPEFVQRFVREARSAVKIQGEHVARVTDVGRLESGAPYMVREYLRGPDLAEVVKVRGRLPVSEAVDYIIQACEGVAEGHALGVVHRNIKPTSLVVTRRSDGTPLVKVFDFAAAESLHVDPFTERSISLVGTSAIMASLPYLAPEQVRDPHDVDVRADVYSLGAVLFELLTGVAVYSAETAPGLLAMVAADAAPPVRHFVPDAPGELDHIVLRCLSKNRAIRYANVAELALALKPFATEDSANSIERIVRLAKISNRPELSAQRPASQPPAVAPLPATPFAPSPSAVPPPPAGASGRGPTGTVMLQMTESARTSVRLQEPGNDDVTAISPHARYVAAPVTVTAPLPPPPTPVREPARYTPQPPPLRTSQPPPLRAATPLPPPLTQTASSQPLPASAPEGRVATSLPPPRSSMPGLTRSWAVPDEPAAPPLLTKNRLIALGVVAACITLAGAFALRTSAPKPAAPAAAAPPPRMETPPPAPAPVAAPEPAAPAASASVVAAPAAAPVVAAAPAGVVGPAAVVPAVAPAAPVMPQPRAVAPARPSVRAATPVASPARTTPAAQTKADSAETRTVAVRPSAGADLFDDPR